ncbi:hypothetical protein B566_EDAN001674 [Ephemera danica]|nr:hypothetical protein B566_EDAN001674 [Ephemera danica]
MMCDLFAVTLVQLCLLLLPLQTVREPPVVPNDPRRLSHTPQGVPHTSPDVLGSSTAAGCVENPVPGATFALLENPTPGPPRSLLLRACGRHTAPLTHSPPHRARSTREPKLSYEKVIWSPEAIPTKHRRTVPVEWTADMMSLLGPIGFNFKIGKTQQNKMLLLLSHQYICTNMPNILIGLPYDQLDSIVTRLVRLVSDTDLETSLIRLDSNVTNLIKLDSNTGLECVQTEPDRVQTGLKQVQSGLAQVQSGHILDQSGLAQVQSGHILDQKKFHTRKDYTATTAGSPQQQHTRLQSPARREKHQQPHHQQGAVVEVGPWHGAQLVYSLGDEPACSPQLQHLAEPRTLAPRPDDPTETKKSRPRVMWCAGGVQVRWIIDIFCISSDLMVKRPKPTV